MIPAHAAVLGDVTQITLVSPAGERAPRAFADLSKTKLEPGKWRARFTAPAADAIEIPPCAGAGARERGRRDLHARGRPFRGSRPAPRARSRSSST